MDFEAGQRHKLRATRRVFDVVSVDIYSGTVTIKFLDDRRKEEFTVSRSDLEGAIYDDAKKASAFGFGVLNSPAWQGGPTTAELQWEVTKYLNATVFGKR